jgi:hypothetical protein
LRVLTTFRSRSSGRESMIFKGALAPRRVLPPCCFFWSFYFLKTIAVPISITQTRQNASRSIVVRRE